MIDTVLLDAGPLGMVSHPRPNSDVIVWLANLISAGVDVLVPEVADYEVRRELLRARKTKSIQRLDHLKVRLGYLPIDTRAMLKAAEFWANARRQGRPTAHHASLDADAILAAQAATLDNRKVIVASSNPRHLKRFVNSEGWDKIKI